jgi:hypothetical protein
VVEGSALVSLRVVGAGLGRTGTHSLKTALEILLGGKCHHMEYVFALDQGALWRDIGRGQTDLLEEALDGFVASCDWPSAAYWELLAEKNPDAVILLSTRSSGEAWFKSASDTIFTVIPNVPDGPWKEMVQELIIRDFSGGDLTDKEATIAAYERHNDYVRKHADPKRLLEWQATDGWEPICKALGVPVPDEPFPHTNSTEDFIGRQLGNQS